MAANAWYVPVSFLEEKCFGQDSAGIARAHRAVGARQGNDDGESHRRDAVTIFMRKPALREAGILPKGGILRLYGRAKIHKSGPVYEEIWNRLIEAEKKGDPEKKGYAVLVTIERAEDLSGQPLT